MDDATAAAIRDAFTLPDVCDGEPGNMVDVLEEVTNAIVFAAKHLGSGDAATSMGALEAHGKAMLDAAALLSGGLHDLADALRERGTL